MNAGCTGTKIGVGTPHGFWAAPVEGIVMTPPAVAELTRAPANQLVISVLDRVCRCGIAHTHMTYSYNAVARGRRVGEGSGEVASKTRLSSGFYSALRKQ